MSGALYSCQQVSNLKMSLGVYKAIADFVHALEATV